jgi:hypothetical protein
LGHEGRGKGETGEEPGEETRQSDGAR